MSEQLPVPSTGDEIDDAEREYAAQCRDFDLIAANQAIVASMRDAGRLPTWQDRMTRPSLPPGLGEEERDG